MRRQTSPVGVGLCTAEQGWYCVFTECWFDEIGEQIDYPGRIVRVWQWPWPSVGCPALLIMLDLKMPTGVKCKRTGWTERWLKIINLFRESIKKKLGKGGRADRFGGGSPPSSLTKTICENVRPFFPLNMIPWYPKQILLHCEEAEKCIFNVFLLPF